MLNRTILAEWMINKDTSRFCQKMLAAILLLPLISIVTVGNVAHARDRIKPVCMDWAKLTVGEYEINNNVWGKRQLHDYSQCVYKTANTKGEFPHDFGWSWDWPKAFDGVKAYPSILYGRKPWNAYSTTLDLPRTINQLQHISVSYKLKTQSTGAVNLLLESWITRNGKPGPEDRLGELAIQLYQIKWPGQAGDFIEPVVINGIPFDFYVARKTHAPGDKQRWAYYGFVHKAKTIFQAKIDIMQFVNFLVRKGYVDRKNYIATVELGNEVDYGKGKTEVEHFSVKVEQ